MIKVIDSIPWVRCASGNVFPSDEEEEDIERIDLGKLKHIEEEERREQNG